VWALAGVAKIILKKKAKDLIMCGIFTNTPRIWWWPVIPGKAVGRDPESKS
jgi:hypothetical protein